MRKAFFFLALLTSGFFAAAFSGAVDFDNSYVAAAAFGVTSYETFNINPRGEFVIDSAYNVGFCVGADFYRNDGHLTHNVSLAVASLEDFRGITPHKEVDIRYNVPIYFTRGRLRPALRPFFGGHYATGKGGGSQGVVGVTFGARYILSPIRCIYSDVYAGWKGRYGADLGATTAGPEEPASGWQDSIVFANANTIEVYLPLCVYITFAVEYDLAKVAGESQKPSFAAGIGPALAW